MSKKVSIKKGVKVGIIRVPMEVFLHITNEDAVKYGKIDCGFHYGKHFFKVDEQYYTFHFATGVGEGGIVSGTIMFCCNDCYKEINKVRKE